MARPAIGTRIPIGAVGDAVAADVRADKTFSSSSAGIAKQGTMPVNGSQTATLQITGAAKPTKVVPAGYTPGGTITAELAASLAQYILDTQTIGGVKGTLELGKKYATGVFSVTSQKYYTVNGLDFAPNMVVWYQQGSASHGVIFSYGIMLREQVLGYYSSGNQFLGRTLQGTSQSSGNALAFHQSIEQEVSNFTMSDDGFRIFQVWSSGTANTRWYAFE